MELSWSQTPNSVWWALESSASMASLHPLGEMPSPRRNRPQGVGRELATHNFYEYADGGGEDELDGEQLADWVKEHPSRGIIRVYQAGSSYFELMRCTAETTAESILARFFAKELFIHYGSSVVRRVQLDEAPLQLQSTFLSGLGYCNPHRIQAEGMGEDLAPLFKFVAGQERGNRLEDRVQLTCALRVKELSSLASLWSKRFCVLCGARIFVFAGAHPRGRPTLILDLTGGSIGEFKSKKYLYCLRVSGSRREVLLAFESRLELSKWLERAAKVVSRHPLEANLAGCSLEKMPKYFFLNSNLVAINLTHNFMQESFDQTDAAFLGQPRTIGWISDLAIFRHLVSLSLSDNTLDQFPISLCNIRTLQELDLSSNRIKVLPQEIHNMSNLTTLLLHSNQLTSLPHSFSELHHLSTLVIAFNKLFEFPEVLKELPALAILVVSGNYISTLPPDINSMSSLQHLDIRLNRLRSKLPRALSELRGLARLNVRGNGISELGSKRLLHLQQLNCSDNTLRSLVIHEGPVQTIIAKNNRITQFTVAPTCDQLTSIDISRNELTSLPETLPDLRSLEKINASDNKLTKLPQRIFLMAGLQVLRVSCNRLISLPSAVGDGCALQLLDLHGNQLSSLPPHLLLKAKSLEVLNVSSNQLASLPPASLGEGVCSLTELYAASNSLRESALPVISGCHRLKVLHLAYNNISSIPAGFLSQLSSLEYVNFSGNSLSSLPPLLGCPKLCYLLLHSNHLTDLPDMPSLRFLHTLDLACNKIETMPKLDSFPRLNFLDLSGNNSLSVRSKAVESLKRVSRCMMEGAVSMHGDAKLLVGRQIDAGGTASHAKWSYGSAQLKGIDSSVEYTAQLKVATLPSSEDGLFALMDGGRSPDVPQALRAMLAGVLGEELARDQADAEAGLQSADPLQYLTHTFLVAHKKLGEIAQSHGCSVVLCHLHALRTGAFVLNVANTGLGEAILCRRGRAVPLTTPHSPATNIQERARVVEASGFISQDNRVNGVCGASRLIGCYHLWPQVVPAPSTESVELMIGDEFVVLGTDSLWKFVTHEQAVLEVQDASSPAQAARRLRDLAVAHGCSTDVSVIVIKLNVFGTAPERKVKVRALRTIPEPVVSEDDDYGVEFTNIDDLLSDLDEEPPSTSSPVKMTKLAGKSDVKQVSKRPAAGPRQDFTADDLDRLVLSAVITPPSSPQSPTVQTTNIDDLIFDTSPTDLDTVITSLEAAHASMNGHKKSAPHKSHNPKPSHSFQQPDEHYPSRTLPKEATQKQPAGSELNYPTRTIPRDASGWSDPTFEKAFEQTQSVPVLTRPRRPYSESDALGDHLALLNEAMSQLDREMNPRRHANINRRLSHVEHSYKQLTNDTYTSGSSFVQSTSNALDLDQWAS